MSKKYYLSHKFFVLLLCCYEVRRTELQKSEFSELKLAVGVRCFAKRFVSERFVAFTSLSYIFRAVMWSEIPQ